MTDYANAPAPRSALFDDAPAKPAYFREPPDTLACAVRISQIRGGQWIAVPHVMQYGQPLRLDLALKRVAIGRTVFVSVEDGPKVLAAVRGGGNGDDLRTA